jgi:hypothetical protein
MDDENTANMSRGRALMTPYDRESLRGEHGDQRKYEAVSRVRARITDQLATDVELIREHNPKLLEDLQNTVCDD